MTGASAESGGLTLLHTGTGLAVANLWTHKVEPIPPHLVDDYAAAKKALSAAQEQVLNARRRAMAYLDHYGASSLRRDWAQWFQEG